MKQILLLLTLAFILICCTEEQKEFDINTRSINDTIPENNYFEIEIDEEWENDLSFEGDLISL